jgi:hypothetical protein
MTGLDDVAVRRMHPDDAYAFVGRLRVSVAQVLP